MRSPRDAELCRRPEEGRRCGTRRADRRVEQRSGGRVRTQAQAHKAPGLQKGGLRPAEGEDAGRLRATRGAVREGTHHCTKRPTADRTVPVAEGKVVEHWSMEDTLGMMQQLSVITQSEDAEEASST